MHVIGNYTELLAKIVLDLDTQALGCSTVYARMTPSTPRLMTPEDNVASTASGRYAALDQTLATIGLLS
jgi:hypothetical protein